MTHGLNTLGLDQLTADPLPVVPGKLWYRNDLGVVCYYDNTGARRCLRTRNRERIRNYGRIYAYTDNRWVTGNDDNYGPTHIQWNEGGGTGADPIVEWEHQGIPIAPNTRITRFYMMARSNSVEVTDFEVCIYKTLPSTPARWEGVGVDNDAEIVSVEIWRDNFFSPASGTAFTGAMNDRHLRIVDISGPNAEYTEFGELRIYFRPVGTITATRYLQTTIMFDTEDLVS